MNEIDLRSKPRSLIRWRRSARTQADSPAIQAYGVPAGRPVRLTAVSSGVVRSADSVPRTSQVTSASAFVGSGTRSSGCGTSIHALTRVPGGSEPRMLATAGSAVSSAVISTQSASSGRQKSTPPLSSTSGARMANRSPGTARCAQREAGPRSPCSAKSMSSSAGSCRTSRTVYVRMTPRVAGSSARHRPYQSRSRTSGSTGACWPGCGRNSLNRWSRPPVTTRASSSPPRTTRIRDGESRSVRATRGWRKPKGTSDMASTDMASTHLLGRGDGLGQRLDLHGALVVGEDRLAGPAENLSRLDRGQLPPSGLAGQVLGLEGGRAVVEHDQVGRVLVGGLPAERLEEAARDLVGDDEVDAEALVVTEVRGRGRQGDVEGVGGR